jgi:hypothetical protein
MPEPHGIYAGHACHPWTAAFQIRTSLLDALASCSTHELHGHVEVLERFQ